MNSTPDELHAAASALRQARFPAAMTATPAVAALLKAREPLAQWLDFEADLIKQVPGAELRGRTQRALAVARALIEPSA
ncbi:hypothetical protein AB0E62_35910 [Streptomyces sp. NPDC038707]|uniref:hypothetical protein n=1 Tax=Streptomyces sp. NPDC038707 TaxID=3154329 RepID=UPI00340E6F95